MPKESSISTVPGRVCGVRSWTLDNSSRLTGWNGAVWADGGRFTSAECPVTDRPRDWRRNRGPAHDPPGPDCSCGLYSFHALPMSIVSYAESSPYTTDSRVSGLIEVGGRVEVHADGMRAERARPIALILPAGLPEEEAARIILAAERHEAELLDVEWFGLKGLLEWCSRHAPPLAVGFIGELTGQQPEDAGFGIDDMAGARKRKMKRALRSGLAQAVARGPAGRPAPRPETWWVLRPIE